MCHPLYPIARRWIGRPVTAYHVNGRTYSGLLQTATPSGIYMMPNAARISFNTKSDDAPPFIPAVRSSEEITAELVYYPGAYFAFGALTGLTLGALASPFWW